MNSHHYPFTRTHTCQDSCILSSSVLPRPLTSPTSYTSKVRYANLLLAVTVNPKLILCRRVNSGPHHHTTRTASPPPGYFVPFPRGAVPQRGYHGCSMTTYHTSLLFTCGELQAEVMSSPDIRGATVNYFHINEKYSLFSPFTLAGRLQVLKYRPRQSGLPKEKLLLASITRRLRLVLRSLDPVFSDTFVTSERTDGRNPGVCVGGWEGGWVCVPSTLTSQFSLRQHK